MKDKLHFLLHFLPILTSTLNFDVWSKESDEFQLAMHRRQVTKFSRWQFRDSSCSILPMEKLATSLDVHASVSSSTFNIFTTAPQGQFEKLKGKAHVKSSDIPGISIYMYGGTKLAPATEGIKTNFPFLCSTLKEGLIFWAVMILLNKFYIPCSVLDISIR